MMAKFQKVLSTESNAKFNINLGKLLVSTLIYSDGMILTAFIVSQEDM